jgi:hypothetical protein
MKYCNKQSVSSGRTLHYLKRIFENDLYNQVDSDELRDFCETYMAYLLDDTSFKIEVVESPKWDSYIIWLGKILNPRIQPFSWDEIKDSYIPFVTMLSREYDLEDKRLDQRASSIIINFVSGNQIYVNVDSIEDWGGLIKRNGFNGNGIKEIGIVVKNTVKQ